MVGSNKTYTIFAGINGAGKSTLYHSMNEDFGVRLNLDEMIANSGMDWRNLHDQCYAARRVLNLQQECFDEGVSMNRETTIGGLGLNRAIQKAKSLGYKIQLFYVGVDSLDKAKQRVLKRVNLGGHGIDEAIMDSRYDIINKRLIDLVVLSDDVKFFDNSNQNMELVAYSEQGKIVKTKNDCKWLDNFLVDYGNFNEKQEKSSSEEFGYCM